MSTLEHDIIAETPPNDVHDSGPEPVKKQENFFVEIIRFTAVALLIVIPIRVFIAQPFIVQGASMEPTFETGEYLIVDQVTYRFHDPKRGDVIVFRYPKDPSKFFIKRVIGVPGDTVIIDQDHVSVANSKNPDGYLLNEPYVAEMRRGAGLTTELKEQEYFVMGDNRNASSDSRVWGTLPAENIIGRAIVRLLPIADIEVLPGTFSQPLEPIPIGSP